MGNKLFSIDGDGVITIVGEVDVPTEKKAKIVVKKPPVALEPVAEKTLVKPGNYRMSYRRLYGLGNFENEAIEIEDEFSHNVPDHVALIALKARVEVLHKQSTDIGAKPAPNYHSFLPQLPNYMQQISPPLAQPEYLTDWTIVYTGMADAKVCTADVNGFSFVMPEPGYVKGIILKADKPIEVKVKVAGNPAMIVKFNGAGLKTTASLKTAFYAPEGSEVTLELVPPLASVGVDMSSIIGVV